MVKCKYANRKATCDLLYVSNSNVCPICHLFEIIMYELSNVLDSMRFESFTLKMKFKDVDDLDETWPAKVACQPAYMHKNWHFYVKSFVCCT